MLKAAMSDPSSPPEEFEGLLPPPDASEAALYDRFGQLGIGWTTVAHPPVFTVEEARALRGGLAGGHSKNLFLKDRAGALWLVVTREHLAVDLNALSKQLGVPRFSFGSAALMAEVLGVLPGAVTPFALMNDRACRVRPVFDEGLLALNPLHFHPLRNDRTTAITGSELLRFAQAGGHTPLVTGIPERT